MNWLTEESERIEKQRNESKWYRLQKPADTVAILLTYQPVKIEKQGEERPRYYYDWNLANGKTLSTTPYLYDQLVRKISNYTEIHKIENPSVAVVEITQKNTEKQTKTKTKQKKM